MKLTKKFEVKLCALLVLALLKLTSCELSCEIPDLAVVAATSIKYEFFTEQAGSNWSLNALVTWDSPAEDGIGHDTYFVQLDTEKFPGTLSRCDLDNLTDSNEYHRTSFTNYTFSDVQFGFAHHFSIFTANLTKPRRTSNNTSIWTSVSLDCYNVTRDVDFCRDLPIKAASSPANPRATCLTPTPSNNMMFESIFIEWEKPVQVHGRLDVFYVEICNGEERILLDSLHLSDDVKAVIQTIDLYPCSLNLQVLAEGNTLGLLRNGTYRIKIYTDVEDTRPWGNDISFTVNTIEIPVCVNWSNWSSWTTIDCCGAVTNQYQNRSRSCEDPYTTSLTCDGPDFQNKTCECSHTTRDFTNGVLLICGSVTVAALFLALIWKCYCRSNVYEDEAPLVKEFRHEQDERTEPSFLPVLILGEKEICQPEENLILDLDKILGRGAQGAVYKGKLRVNSEWIDVAVKTPKIGDMTNSPENQNVKADFLKEIKFSIEIQQESGHPNILPVLGCCTTKEPYYLVTPLMKYGDLLSFLRKCRKVRPEDLESQSPYCLTSVDQLNFLWDIARGMEFLSTRRCYMGDLAASNVLVGENLVAKIADFGLAYDLYLTNGMVQREQNKPFTFRPRWVSLETFESNGAKCNLKSDVWSFGVVMYEVYTFGEVPYSQFWSNKQILKELKRGYRLERPPGCPPDVYDIMLRCWQADPNQRPTFTTLVREFTQKINALTCRPSIQKENTEITSIHYADEDKVPRRKNEGGDSMETAQNVTSGESDHLRLWPASHGLNTSSNGLDFIPDSNQNGTISDESVVNRNMVSGRPDYHGLWNALMRGITSSSAPKFIPDSKQNRTLSDDSVIDESVTSDESGSPDYHGLWARLIGAISSSSRPDFIPITNQNYDISDDSDATELKRKYCRSNTGKPDYHHLLAGLNATDTSVNQITTIS